jgi:arylsulfatase A-like enzyme
MTHDGRSASRTRPRRGAPTPAAALASLAAVCLATLIAPAPAVAGPGDRARDDRPNIILVVADDLSRRWCGFMPEGGANALTPNLDALAAEGVALHRLHSPAPVCTPSRYALLTGRYPSRCAEQGFRREAERAGQTVVTFNTHITPGDVTLPRLLQDAGYRTGAVGKNHVISVPGFVRVHYLADPEDPEVAATLDRNERLVREAFLRSGFDEADSLYFGNPDSDGIRKIAVHNQEWIDGAAHRFIERNRDRPFFLYFATTVPHGPFEPERSWRADPQLTPYGRDASLPAERPRRETIPDRLAAHDTKGWNRENVLWLDDSIGDLVEKLRELGLDDNTIIVAISDHGTEAKGSVYERGTLTAGLVWRKGGFATDDPITTDMALMDIAPTILRWAGAEIADRMDGRPIQPVLDGETDTLHESMYFEIGYSRAVVKDGLKYVALRYPAFAESMSLEERTRRLTESNRVLEMRGRPLPTEDPTAPFSHISLIPGGEDAEQVSIGKFPSYFEPDQLYDLRSDPTEQVNLASDPEYAHQLAELRELLNDYVTDLPDRFGEFGYEGFESDD